MNSWQKKSSIDTQELPPRPETVLAPNTSISTVSKERKILPFVSDLLSKGAPHNLFEQVSRLPYGNKISSVILPPTERCYLALSFDL